MENRARDMACLYAGHFLCVGGQIFLWYILVFRNYFITL